MEEYPTNQDCSMQVSDIHLEQLTSAHCGKWRYLPPHLGLDNTTKDDIDRKYGDERERRYNFFMEWKERMGAEATYKALINGLLKIGCRGDAEYVCQLIQPISPDSQETAHATSSLASKEPALTKIASSKSSPFSITSTQANFAAIEPPSTAPTQAACSAEKPSANSSPIQPPAELSDEASTQTTSDSSGLINYCFDMG